MTDLNHKNIYPFEFVKYLSILGVFIQLIIGGLPFVPIIIMIQFLPLFLLDLSRGIIYLMLPLAYIWYFWWLVKARKQVNSFGRSRTQRISFLLILISLILLCFSFQLLELTWWR